MILTVNMKIYSIRTLYPHWSRYSGYNRLLEHYSNDVTYIEKAVAMGDDRFPNITKLKDNVRQRLSKYVPKSYALNDLMAEITILLLVNSES